MQREYHKWHSDILGRDMELFVFGQGGTPLLVFPTSMGRFYQYEDQGMIAATQQKYENGQLQAFCVDSVDEESWYNQLLWLVAKSAVELLTSSDLHQVKECPGNKGCGWLFLDTSKNGSRQWCSMEGCGSRAKRRRQYGRLRRATLSAS